jgi:uncharacterized protein with beta-barrel porin domain
MAVMNASLYAMGELAIQSMSGKTPESPTNPKFIFKTVAGSGFGGIATDALSSLLADANPDTGTVFKAIAGTTLSGLAEPLVAGAKAAKAAAAGDSMGRSADAMTKAMLLDNMPFVRNLPVVSGVWNFYVANEIREAVNSGYKMNQKIRMMDTPALGGGRQKYWLPKP